MIKSVKISFLLLCFITLASSCKKKNTNQVNSTGNSGFYVNYSIYASTPEFFNISIPGGWIYISAGEKGIIVYRLSNTDFLAFERKCPHDGVNNGNAIVKVQADNYNIKDTICGSKFSIIDGQILQGPSTKPLYQYITYFDGNVLNIHN